MRRSSPTSIAKGLANTGAWINSNVHVGHWHPNLEVPLYASGIYGLIILIVMLFRPEGLIPSRRRAAELHEGVHDEPLYDAMHAGRRHERADTTTCSSRRTCARSSAASSR